MKVEESVSGALLGLLGALGANSVGFCSTFGLEVNSEDIIWTGWRGLGGASAADGRWESFRGRLDGRSSSATLAFVWERFRVRSLRFSTLFDWSLRMVKYIMLHQYRNPPVSPSTTLLCGSLPGRWSFLEFEI